MSTSVSVQIPTTLHIECGVDSRLEVSATSVAEVLKQLRQQYPCVYRRICDETGAVRRHINLFINDSLLPRQAGTERRLERDDVLFIMTAVSGG